MKKVIIFLISASVIGVLISFIFYNRVKNELNVKGVSIFQTGVYSSYDEAFSSCNNKANIIYDGKLYHVYDSVVSSTKAKERMISFYKQNNIDYYIKEKYVNLNIYEEIEKYSKLIELSDDDAIKIINKTVIEKLGDDIV